MVGTVGRSWKAFRFRVRYYGQQIVYHPKCKENHRPKEVGKDVFMNNERIISVSTDSKIYHKPGCRYVDRIKYKNKMSLPRHDARAEGYHVCRYCNSMNHHIKGERNILDYYEQNKNMQFKYIDGILYVKSEIGCWKLVYIRKEEKIALYHRNTVVKALDFEHPQNEPYHRQEDKAYCYTIAGYLDYIYEHDKYKAALQRGDKVIKFSNKKYERYAVNAKRKKQNKRVDYLFRMLDRQNEGYRQLSYC